MLQYGGSIDILPAQKEELPIMADTAATVSAISGRGVGMDVVKRSIQALGGRINDLAWDGESRRIAVGGEGRERDGREVRARDAHLPGPHELRALARAEVPVVDCSYPGGHAWPPIGTRGVWGFFSRL